MADSQAVIQSVQVPFNNRDVPATLAITSPDVKRPKAPEGGRVVGPDQIRSSCTRRWSESNPHSQALTGRSRRPLPTRNQS